MVSMVFSEYPAGGSILLCLASITKLPNKPLRIVPTSCCHHVFWNSTFSIGENGISVHNMAINAPESNDTLIFIHHVSFTFGTSQKINAITAINPTIPPIIKGMETSMGLSRPPNSFNNAKSPTEIGEFRNSIFKLLAAAKPTNKKLTNKLATINHFRGKMYSTLKMAIKMMTFNTKRSVNSDVHVENGIVNAFRTIVSLIYKVNKGSTIIKPAVKIQTKSFFFVKVSVNFFAMLLTLFCIIGFFICWFLRIITLV